MKSILYYSTNGKATPVSFKDALLKGLAPDKGLYMPDSIPRISNDELSSLFGKEYSEIAYNILKKFLYDQVPSADLKEITKDAYNFEVPMEKIYERKYVIRLDQGPTASFKDFAARVMGRLMQYFLEQENKRMLILTATSGDTGSAIANAFYKLKNIDVVLLYPENEVTERQRKQMTTLKENIKVLAVKGKFDDCQAMAKQAFSDSELDHLPLSSANSINIGRLLPQAVYYFYAFSKLARDVNDKTIFSVPSGNFGNLMGGLIARKMGLPVKKFVVATNENNEVPLYFRTGKYQPIVPSYNCISSAMNVGHPSNLARVIALYDGMMDEKGTIVKSPDIDKIKDTMYAVSITDKETRETILRTYKDNNVLLEPHGSVGWSGLKRFFTNYPEMAEKEQLSVVLETANPAKFPKEIKEILSIEPEIPESLKGIDKKEESYETIENDYPTFKNYLKEKYKG